MAKVFHFLACYLGKKLETSDLENSDLETSDPLTMIEIVNAVLH